MLILGLTENTTRVGSSSSVAIVVVVVVVNVVASAVAIVILVTVVVVVVVVYNADGVIVNIVTVSLFPCHCCCYF